jgi:hypothetical protein
MRAWGKWCVNGRWGLARNINDDRADGMQSDEDAVVAGKGAYRLV